MKINLPDTGAPQHWRRLQPIIERDNQLRPDVTAFVAKKGCAFFDGAGRKLDITLPARFTGAKITDPNSQLALITWLWRTFPRETPGVAEHLSPARQRPQRVTSRGTPAD